MDISGVVLVVGGGSGIGRATAQRLASLGADVLVCADLNLEAATETATLCQKLERPGRPKTLSVAAHQVDVRDEASVDGLMNQVAKTYGRIDIVVTTAGFGPSSETLIRDMPLDTWRAFDDVHNIGCFLLTRAALRVMDAQDLVTPPTAPDRPPVRGTIVILTSAVGEGGFAASGHYVAAKHAVKGMVQTAAIENAARGIRVNAVAPTYVSGPLLDKFIEGYPELGRSYLSDLPMGRMASPAEVADIVAFLASPASSYVNGHTLVADGAATVSLRNQPFGGSS